MARKSNGAEESAPRRVSAANIYQSANRRPRVAPLMRRFRSQMLR